MCQGYSFGGFRGGGEEGGEKCQAAARRMGM